MRPVSNKQFSEQKDRPILGAEESHFVIIFSYKISLLYRIYSCNCLFVLASTIFLTLNLRSRQWYENSFRNPEVNTKIKNIKASDIMDVRTVCPGLDI